MYEFENICVSELEIIPQKTERLTQSIQLKYCVKTYVQVS